ncbi:MAG TPA: AAA family ATPase [Nitrososphaeraceae archaeon]|nr:AAA family ATPase [Nitrososphaeraceae archaeon]
MIILICGLPGTGKTFLAHELSKHIDSTVLSTDKIRKELIPKPTYAPWERSLIYDVLFLLVKYLHNSGINCILDGTFNMEKSRYEVKNFLNLTKKEFYIIECICPEDIIISRLLLRKGDYSDATVSIYLKMKRIYEKIRENHISINTAKPIDGNINKILEYVYGSKNDKVIGDNRTNK